MNMILDLQKIKAACQNHNISYLGVFGSVARNEQTPQSDIDLLVEFEETKSLLEEGRAVNELESIFDRKVDLVSKRFIKPQLVQYINKDLQTIYEKRK